MTYTVSTKGLTLPSINSLLLGQKKLANLSNQLASGVVSGNLTNYTAVSAYKIVDLNSNIELHDSFIDLSKTIRPRMNVYDISLNSLEGAAREAIRIINATPNYNPTQNSNIAVQFRTSMLQVRDALNQEVGGRYIFAGSRFTTPPVVDITTLPVPPTEPPPYTVSSPAVPAYDVGYDPLLPGAPISAAWEKDTIYISKTQTLTYGVTSNDTAFQKLIMGLRKAYSATQDQSNYTTLINEARTLLSDAVSEMQLIHAKIASDTKILTDTSDQHEQSINLLENQLSDVRDVDINEVSAKIKSLELNLNASYSATSILIQSSILNYLR